MKIQFTILGLGQIGTSVGMVLADHKEQFVRVGHDKSPGAAKQAKEKNAIDKVATTLSEAVKNADIVLLALPFQEIYPVLKHIAQDLKEDALVMDTGPLKQPVLKWAEELLPQNRYYIGLTPVIDSPYLEDLDFGPQTAQKDLFSNSLMAVISGTRSSEAAVNAAVSLVQLLGASPYFTDPSEIDGLMTMTHIMPRLLAAALQKTIHDAPGWREARKFAGKAYTQVTNPLTQDDAPGALAAAVIYNQENTTRVMNDVIRTLVEIRDLSETPGQKELEELFTQLQKDRELWWVDRRESSWTDIKMSEIPRRTLISQLFGIGRRDPRRKDKDQ